MRDEGVRRSLRNGLFVELAALVLVVLAFGLALAQLREWMMHSAGRARVPIGEMFIGFAFASVVTVFLTPILWLLLRRKQPRQAKRGLLAYGCVSGLLCVFVDSWLAMLSGPGVVVLLSIMRAFTLPAFSDRPDHCDECDYDLTGNESGVCPECGTPVGAA